MHYRKTNAKGKSSIQYFREQLELQTRRADRFWYENYFAQSGFNEAQLSEIRNTKLAEIICSNIDIRRIQRNVFFREDVFE